MTDQGPDTDARTREMATEVTELRQVIAGLTARLEVLEAGRPPVGSSDPAPDRSTVDATDATPALATSTNRRKLLTTGVAAAAGAALASTAAGIATASPAAAAAGTFDGNPAVTGTASPSNGTGVFGTTDTGIGVDGKASAVALGTGTGVRGQAWFGTGVLGEALGATNATGVEGRTSSTTSQGVYGRHLAATGTGEGIRGVSASPNGIGVHGETGGEFGSGVGVRGKSTSNTGIGVFGQSTSGIGGTGVKGEGVFLGVHGACDTELGTGVLGVGEGTSSMGVRGLAPDDQGVGVTGHADGVGGRGAVGNGRRFGVVALSETSQLGLSSTTTLPLPPLDAGQLRGRGEIAFDGNSDLWLCVAEGNPGTWRRLSGPATAGAFVPLAAPVRAYDSRPPFPPATGPKTKLTPNQARSVDCTLNGTTVPATATGVLVSLVATGSNAAGHVAIYRDTIPYPNTSNANFAAGQTVAVTTFSALTAGKVAVYSNQAIDVVLDILGYYQ